ncbi:FKBP-type peptidyl-prolyl cis-trans isomerase [Sphingomonas sabuli]|uniref:Peptidyl-prolyl cis-trans isomerase n=1 Tax=Sphingomonas sabuli TaxID=2764186 RepID=A0A7G9KZN4_9SPHN|nr:FKBP-type peptidyl-prolyl cis-trans isomerase [Sphingomonas sabuli]QNM81833.1 FKBP-type peptidyl-prolyl cis-trans isomerase [Sphingomonas sabuli]
MSSSTTAATPPRTGSLGAFWLVILALVAAGVALAWYSTSGMRGETLPSGIVIRTVQAGTGAPIGMQDGVLINYEGRLPDGTVFDSNAGSGPSPMLVGQTVPGFAEALTHMQKGGSYRIRIPSELAYGPTPPPNSPIPPNADLDFDVQVAEVVPNAAQAMAPPPSAAQPQGSEAPPQPQPQPSE